jgi:hypothetical protein
MSEEDKFIKPIKPIFRKLRSTKERPVIKLTAGLLITYKQINEVIEKKKFKKKKYFEKLQSYEDDDCDDEEGNYIPIKGEKINGRYIVEGQLGSGSFGVVIKGLKI